MRPASATRSSRLRPIVLLVALPLVLLVLNDTWIWDSTHYYDTNVYVGFFRHYTQFRYPFTFAYKSSRLPFLLPGALLYKLFPAGAAHHLLFLVFHWLEVVALYLFARRRYGAHAAFVAAGAAAVFTFGHMAPSYHNQAASALFLSSLVLLDMPERWPRRARVMAAGGAFALAVVTDMIVAALAPLLVLQALAMLRPWGKRAAIDAAVAVAGGVVAVVALGVVNVLLGGPFLYFVRQVRMTLVLMSLHTSSNLPVLPMFLHPGKYPHLMLPLVTLLGSILVLVSRVARLRFDRTAFESLGFAVAMAMAVLFEARGTMVLENAHLFHPFFVAVFLGLAALLGSCLPRRAEPIRWRFLLAASALLVAPLSLAGAPLSRWVLHVSRIWPPSIGEAPLGMALALGVTGAASVLALRRRPWASMLAASLVFGLFNAIITDPYQGAYLYQVGARCPFRREAFEALIEADDAMNRFDPEGKAEVEYVDARQLLPVFDGKGWCRLLPLDTVTRNMLLVDYFYTDEQYLAYLRHAHREPRPTKVVLSGRTPAEIARLLARIRARQPRGTVFTQSFERRIVRSTFEALLRGYEVTPPGR